MKMEEYISKKHCEYCSKQINSFDWYHWPEDQFLKPKHQRKCIKRIEDELCEVMK